MPQKLCSRIIQIPKPDLTGVFLYRMWVWSGVATLSRTWVETEPKAYFSHVGVSQAFCISETILTRFDQLAELFMYTRIVNCHPTEADRVYSFVHYHPESPPSQVVNL